MAVAGSGVDISTVVEATVVDGSVVAVDSVVPVVRSIVVEVVGSGVDISTVVEATVVDGSVVAVDSVVRNKVVTASVLTAVEVADSSVGGSVGSSVPVPPVAGPRSPLPSQSPLNEPDPEKKVSVIKIVGLLLVVIYSHKHHKQTNNKQLLDRGWLI